MIIKKIQILLISLILLILVSGIVFLLDARKKMTGEVLVDTSAQEKGFIEIQYPQISEEDVLAYLRSAKHYSTFNDIEKVLSIGLTINGVIDKLGMPLVSSNADGFWVYTYIFLGDKKIEDIKSFRDILILLVNFDLSEKVDSIEMISGANELSKSIAENINNIILIGDTCEAVVNKIGNPTSIDINKNNKTIYFYKFIDAIWSGIEINFENDIVVSSNVILEAYCTESLKDIFLEK